MSDHVCQIFYTSETINKNFQKLVWFGLSFPNKQSPKDEAMSTVLISFMYFFFSSTLLKNFRCLQD